MQYKTIIRSGAILMAASFLTLTACRRDKTTTTTPALTSSDDNGGYASDAAKLESTNNDVLNMADNAATYGSANLRISSCVIVTNDTTSTPRVLTINFGSGCSCADGKYRSGEIIVTYSGRYKDSGSIHTISYSNYYVDSNKVTGSKTVTNEGTNSSGQVWYTVSINDTITLTTDSMIYWTATRTRTWYTGYSTATRTDDSYLIADAPGGATVLHRANGHVFTLTITSPLLVAFDCPYIEAGEMTIASTTFTAGDRTLNYTYPASSLSGASCDDQAQLTIGSHTYDILLR
jgi:predicted alpha/beta hydrolase family esterase